MDGRERLGAPAVVWERLRSLTDVGYAAYDIVSSVLLPDTVFSEKNRAAAHLFRGHGSC
jgi:hypothetical protein